MSDNIKAGLITGLICLALAGLLYLMVYNFDIIFYAMVALFIFIPIYWIYQFVLESIRRDKS